MRGVVEMLQARPYCNLGASELCGKLLDHRPHTIRRRKVTTRRARQVTQSHPSLPVVRLGPSAPRHFSNAVPRRLVQRFWCRDFEIFQSFFFLLLAGNIIYPNDTVRRRLQTEAGSRETYLQATRMLLKEGGISRLYRGFLLYNLKAAPSAAVQFYTYHTLKQLWIDQSNATKKSSAGFAI